jgi:hypothetical protein
MRRLFGTAPPSVVACLEQQLGRVSDRNSCRNPWSQALDLRASFRPNLPGLERRLTASLDANNVLTGLDQLVHGRDGMKGWGEGARAESTLLQVRGFDAVTNAFVYEVNEGFGQARRGANALRAPFALRLSVRVTLGGQPQMSNRAFGAGGMGGFGEAPGGGGMGGFGARGGEMGGLLTGVFGGAEGVADAMAQARSIRSMLMRGETPQGGAVAAVLLPNAVRTILAVKDSLGLSAAQTDTLEALADTLDARLAPRRDSLAPVLEDLARSLAAVRSGAPGPAILDTLQTRVRDDIQPHVAAARPETEAIMARVRAVLTEEQWRRIPALVRRGRRAGRPGR